MPRSQRYRTADENNNFFLASCPAVPQSRCSVCRFGHAPALPLPPSLCRCLASPSAGVIPATPKPTTCCDNDNGYDGSDNSACTALEWDPLGLCLAIAQANSSVVLLWFTRQWKTRAVDVGVKVRDFAVYFLFLLVLVSAEFVQCLMNDVW